VRRGVLVAVVGVVALASACEPLSAPAGREGPGEPIGHVFGGSDVGLTLARYDVVDGDLVGRRASAAVPATLTGLRDDEPAHREAWSLWWGLAPEPWRSTVVRFLVATDGSEDILASVAPLDDGLDRWVLQVDPADLGDQDGFEETMVHELGHILSLRSDQLARPLDAPEGFPTLASARRGCRPALGVEDGCLQDDAYLAAFIERFWDEDLLGRADAIGRAIDPIAAAEALFEEDPLRFASDYAATHPVEDFAESWVTFVLYEYEGVDEEWADKGAFFDGYPELVAAREHIWRLLDVAP